MTGVSFFFHAPLMNEVSPFTASAVKRNCNTQTERGREKVDMREIHEWSLGCHPRHSYMCQSFASEHRNKSESQLPPTPHPLSTRPFGSLSQLWREML